MEPKRRRLAPDTRLVQAKRAIADHASAFLGRVARIAKIDQPHLEVTLARHMHEAFMPTKPHACAHAAVLR